MKLEVQKTPITLCDKLMKESQTIKYLGDSLCSTLEDSVHQTVLKRVGIAKKSIIDIRTVVEDKRAEHIGGFNVAMDIWEAAVIPMLFNNADTWTNVQKKTIKVLDDIFTTFYRCMFRIGSGCPKVNYYWQLATLMPANIILQKKIMFIFHIANLPEQSLAREVYELQDREELPGLILENKEHLVVLNFKVNKNMSKFQFRKLVKNYIRNKNKTELLQSIREYKKIDYNQCFEEEYKRKSYFYDMNLEQTRTRFRISSKMLQTVKSNFSSKYKHTSMSCQSCKGMKRETEDSEDDPIDSQSHLLTSCLAFSDIRDQYDTNTDLGLVKFFSAVIERRIEEEEEERDS